MIGIEKSDLSVKHLETELMRVDVLFHREVWRWQAAGQDISDVFRGQYVSDDEADKLVKLPFGTSWGQSASLGEDEKTAYANALNKVDAVIHSIIEDAKEADHSLRLQHLTKAFGLDQFELDTLLVCLAPTLDLRYERIYGYLQDDVTKKRPSVNLVLNTLCTPGSDRLTMLERFTDSSPLFKYNILYRTKNSTPGAVPLLSQSLSVDDTIVGWLLGDYQPHYSLSSHMSIIRPDDNEHDVLLASPIQKEIEGLIDGSEKGSTPPLVSLFGDDVSSQQAATKQIALKMQRELLIANMNGAVKKDIPADGIVNLVLRDARLIGAIPYFTGWDSCLKEGMPSVEVYTALCEYSDWVVVAGKERWHAAGIDRSRRIAWIKTEIPAYGQRLKLWQHFLGEGADNKEYDVPNLAGQFRLTAGQIRDAVATAHDEATQAAENLMQTHLFNAARAHSSPRLSALAMKITPRYDWDDIVLPKDQLMMLREVIATVRGRPIVLDEWGVGKKLASSYGLTMLFAGPPGTGKTMSAEVIARELGLDLYKINLSSIVSKFIGETEKNLEKIFNEAENSNAILFFDEADALFGKRSEVKDSHDRYANIEISYLLQRMEAYNGVTILATNLRANLDEAFTRRLQFAIDFPFPDKDYRLKIWEALFPPEVPRDAHIDFTHLAQRYKLTGGNIRNVIVSAAYLAATDGSMVTMDHLNHGTRRELQKMGRLIPEDEFIQDEE